MQAGRSPSATAHAPHACRAIGVDFTYFWDPELWVKFKDAVWQDAPAVFWNGLVERIEYSALFARVGTNILCYLDVLGPLCTCIGPMVVKIGAGALFDTVVFTGFGDRRVWGFSKNGGSNMGHDMHLGMPCL